MGTAHRPLTTAQPTARPFDSKLSARLDLLIIELETTNPNRWRRRTIKLRKWLAERSVPASHPGRAGR